MIIRSWLLPPCGRQVKLVQMAVVAVIMGATSLMGRAQPEPNLCETSARHVPTVPPGLSCDAQSMVVVEPQAVRTRPGQTVVRPVYRWATPLNASSMCWEGSMVPGSVEFGGLHPQGFRGNIGTLGAWVPPNLFPRSDTLGEGSEALLPPAMERAATGWQGQRRATIDGTVGRSRNAARRIREHLRTHPAFRDVDPRHIESFSARIRGGHARRGAEQELMDDFANWFRKAGKGKLVNVINGVDPRNKEKRRAYRKAFRILLSRL